VRIDSRVGFTFNKFNKLDGESVLVDSSLQVLGVDLRLHGGRMEVNIRGAM